MSVARSLLFVPGDRTDRFDKAVASGADFVILDLEDAMRPAVKNAARKNVHEWLEAGGRAAIHANGLSTRWHGNDLAVLQMPGATAAMLPKVEDAASLDGFGASLPAGVAIIALVERRSVCGTRARSPVRRGWIGWRSAPSIFRSTATSRTAELHCYLPGLGWFSPPRSRATRHQ